VRNTIFRDFLLLREKNRKRFLLATVVDDKEFKIKRKKKKKRPLGEAHVIDEPVPQFVPNTQPAQLRSPERDWLDSEPSPDILSRCRHECEGNI
jgi:hypothetical protein